MLFGPTAGAAPQDTVVPQTAFSPCAAVEVIEREDLPAGTGLAVSPDGKWLALYAHTMRGGEVRIRPRPGRESGKPLLINPPELPPGVTWRIVEAEFSPDSSLLILRSVGAIHAFDTATGALRFLLEPDRARQLYPGNFALSHGHLFVAYWPPESYFADAKSRHAVEVRVVELSTGALLRAMQLPLETSSDWMRLRATPQGDRLAVLERATRWPSKARLSAFAADSGKLLWRHKLGAEDVRWSEDGNSLLALGRRLQWLDAATGKSRREAEGDAGTSEFHQFRFSTAGNLVAGQASRFSRLKRAIALRHERETVIFLWRLDSGKVICSTPLPPTVSAALWPIAGGELIALEETYELRPPLRLLKGARIVTYRPATK
jgi:outer membrane protein assembly factor BamB